MPPSADLIVENASVLTMDPGQAARSRRSPSRAAKSLRSATSKSIGDLKGPGTETHRRRRAIPSCPASSRRTCICSPARPSSTICSSIGVHGFEALEQAVRAYALAQPDDEAAAGTGRRLHDPFRKRARHAPPSRPDHPRPALHHVRARSPHRCGPIPRRSNSPACCTARRSGRATKSSWARTDWPTGELREGEAFGPLLELCRREPRAAGPGDRRRARSVPDAAGTGARSRDHEARARLVRQARHHLDPEHGRQSLPARAARRDRGEGELAVPRADPVPLQELHDARRAREGVGDGRAVQFRMAVLRHRQVLL